MKVATWNVNSIRARLDHVLGWLADARPDVLCLQETKVADGDFPSDAFQRAGYAVAVSGQKSYNGVALASRAPLEAVTAGLHDEPDPAEKRLLRATVQGVRVCSVYVPNGQEVGSPAFAAKLRWLARLRETLLGEGVPDRPLLLCGDFNVAPDDRDVHDPEAHRGQLHFHPDEHRALADLLALGLVDLYRRHHPEGGRYSWWDYRMGAFRRNLGLRIDLVLGTPDLAARSAAADIDTAPRRLEKPSDHAPVIVEIA